MAMNTTPEQRRALAQEARAARAAHITRLRRRVVATALATLALATAVVAWDGSTPVTAPAAMSGATAVVGDDATTSDDTAQTAGSTDSTGSTGADPGDVVSTQQS
jgi:hypothetical protein